MAETINMPEIIAGVALCLLGWTLYWIGLHAIGVAVGGALGAFLGMAFDAVFDPNGAWTLPILAICAGLGALIGVFVIKKAHKMVFFILGLLAGGVAAQVTWPSVAHLSQQLTEQYSSLAQWLYIGAIAIICGALMIPFSKYLIIVATALIGSILLVFNLEPRYAGPGLVFFFVASLLIQLMSHRQLGRPNRSIKGRQDAE